MRIIGKNHDYYDSAQAYGVDKQLIYVRENQEIEFDKSPFKGMLSKMIDNLPFYNYYGFDRLDMPGYIIGFCGKLYPVFVFRIWSTNLNYFNCYNSEDIADVLRIHRDKGLKSFLETPKHKHISPYQFSKHRIDRFMDEWNALEHTDLFFEYKVPVFIIKPKRRKQGFVLELNPILRKYEFFKLFDAYQAHQEIDMFLGGVLGNLEADTVGIDDKHLMQQKGFDKWSFKTMPGTKKKRKDKK